MVMLFLGKANETLIFNATIVYTLVTNQFE